MTSVKQKGAALIVSMLVLSLVVVFAASMTVEYDFSLRRMSNQMTAQQAQQYLLSVESAAEALLRYDFMEDDKNEIAVDKWSDIWASKNGQELPLGEALAEAYLYDLQGRFNLNSLAKVHNPGEGKLPPQIPYTIEQGIFIRLILAVADEDLPIEMSQALEITEAVVDWLDEDSQPTGFAGCEDDAYYGIEDRRAHRTANSAFASVSELRLICNMPVELYRRLQPWVTVWPMQGDAGININTSVYLQPVIEKKDEYGEVINDSPLLRSIIMDKATATTLKDGIDGKTQYNVPPPLSYLEVKSVIEKLTAGGFSDYATLDAELGAYQRWPGAKLNLHSSYFLLETDVLLGDMLQSMSSVIHRNEKDGKISILARSTGGL